MEKSLFCSVSTLFLIAAGFGYVDSITHLDSECLPARNSTENTIYRANLRTLLDSLVRNAPLQDGFFNTSIGNGSNQVYGLVWCRADVSPNECFKCLNNSVSIPLRECPEIKDLVIWSSLCTLRFSNESFVGQLWNRSSSSTYGGHGLDDPEVFSRGFSMMESLGRNVSKQPLMFETGVIVVGKKGERYGLGQCSRDLSKLDCENCLEDLLTSYGKYVLNRTGWEMTGVSCGMWYDNIRFYDDNSGLTPPPLINPSASAGSGERGDHVMLGFVAFLVSYWIP